MSRNKFSILQISPTDGGGGAELTAFGLFKGYQKNGCKSYLVVNRKTSEDVSILEIDNDSYRNIWIRCWSKIIDDYDNQSHRLTGLGQILRGLKELGQLWRRRRVRQGYDDFDFPGTARIFERLPEEVDITHCHNLHGSYFDLRELETFSKQQPLVLTMHDAWLLSGHCAFSLTCERWKHGCGDCPDLTLFPAIRKDQTAANWAAKRAIFGSTKLHLVTPSQWLMDMAQQSLLADSLLSCSVIPNSVDTDVFYPRQAGEIRDELGIDPFSKVLMIAANGLVHNPWKDFVTLRKALEQLPVDLSVTVLAVGHSGEDENIGSTFIRYIPFERDPGRLADYYCASDVYVHCAHVEVFATVTLEARACGIPVIASAVGGIPEHVKGLDWDGAPRKISTFDRSEADGVLCPPGDPDVVSDAIQLLLRDSSLCDQLGQNGGENVTKNFTNRQQVERHLALYQSILENGGKRAQ